LEAFAAIVQLFFELYSFVILARVLMSWVNIDPYSPLARTIYDLTEPVLAPVRNLMPSAGGFDFSPIIVLILLQVLGSMIVMMLAG
jgi:YggT family protein